MNRKALNLASIYVKSPGRLCKDDVDRQMAETVEYCEARGLEIGVWFGDPKYGRAGFQ